MFVPLVAIAVMLLATAVLMLLLVRAKSPLTSFVPQDTTFVVRPNGTLKLLVRGVDLPIAAVTGITSTIRPLDLHKGSVLVGFGLFLPSVAAGRVRRVGGGRQFWAARDGRSCLIVEVDASRCGWERLVVELSSDDAEALSRATGFSIARPREAAPRQDERPYVADTARLQTP